MSFLKNFRSDSKVIRDLGDPISQPTIQKLALIYSICKICSIGSTNRRSDRKTVAFGKCVR